MEVRGGYAAKLQLQLSEPCRKTIGNVLGARLSRNNNNNVNNNANNNLDNNLNNNSSPGLTCITDSVWSFVGHAWQPYRITEPERESLRARAANAKCV